MEREAPGFPGKLYGSSTVSDRGQIVIPAEARREMGLEAGTRLLIFGAAGGRVLTLMTGATICGFISGAMERLAEFENLIEEAPAHQDDLE